MLLANHFFFSCWKPQLSLYWWVDIFLAIVSFQHQQDSGCLVGPPLPPGTNQVGGDEIAASCRDGGVPFPWGTAASMGYLHCGADRETIEPGGGNPSPQGFSCLSCGLLVTFTPNSWLSECGSDKKASNGLGRYLNASCDESTSMNHEARGLWKQNSYYFWFMILWVAWIINHRNFLKFVSIPAPETLCE